jgi:hypothetical protein
MGAGTVKSEIDRVLAEVKSEVRHHHLFHQEIVRGPFLSLDHETYRLLSEKAQGSCYATVFSQAVRSLRDYLTEADLAEICSIIKIKRARGQNKLVKSRVAQKDFEWVLEASARSAVKPARVLEALSFVFVRADLPTS